LLFIGTRLRGEFGIELDVGSVRSFAEGLGPLGPLLFVGVVALRSFLALPSQVVLMAAGLCFGTAVGTLIGGTGLMLSGLGIFLAVRFTGAQELTDRLRGRFDGLMEALGHRAGAVVLALGSGYPISPLSPIHAVAGLTQMSVGLFVLAAFAGGLLRAAIFAFFGNAISESSGAELLMASGALLLVLAIPFSFRSGRSWLRRLFGLGPKSLPTSMTAHEEG
jgi:uncharacterized membrane protein YdjX (TVP38/TMEM64 family)